MASSASIICASSTHSSDGLHICRGGYVDVLGRRPAVGVVTTEPPIFKREGIFFELFRRTLRRPRLFAQTSSTHSSDNLHIRRGGHSDVLGDVGPWSMPSRRSLRYLRERRYFSNCFAGRCVGLDCLRRHRLRIPRTTCTSVAEDTRRRPRASARGRCRHDGAPFFTSVSCRNDGAVTTEHLLSVLVSLW